MLYINIIIYFIYLNLMNTKVLHMFQQNKYNLDNRYLKWLFKHLKNILINVNLLVLITIIMFFTNIEYLFSIIYLLLIILFIINKKNTQDKIPLKYTSRVKRLFLTTNIFYLLLTIIIFNLFDNNICYQILNITLYLLYFIIIIINIINKPLEYLVYTHYKKLALNKLATMNKMDVIGITGSYGKTSSKNIVYSILNSTYSVYKTPENYNTPNGILLTINNYLDKFNDYFVVEMGACKKGDIKELCDLVHPKYGILTRIGIAHLETFKSEENIINTKFELIESLPSDGIGILNGDDPKQLNYQIKNNCEIVWIGIDNHDVDIYAKDIKLDGNKTSFKVHFKDENKDYEFTTTLLGNYNIYNILEGIALGRKLGIKIEDLIKSVKALKPVSHRLERKLYYDINLIDDSYNNNPLGSKMAIEVLSKMNGKKIIITSGMIELGNKYYEENKNIGYLISKYQIDEVILIGKKQTEPIYDGLKENNYNLNKVHILNNIMDSFKLIRELKDKDTYVLLQSDLPDLYNENSKE